MKNLAKNESGIRPFPRWLLAGRLREMDLRLSRRHRRVTDEQFKHRFLYAMPGQDKDLYPPEAVHTSPEAP